MFAEVLDKRFVRIIIMVSISLIIIFLSADNFFFWDTISQISIPANWYFDNNFRYFFVPDEFATGHPTFVGIYIAFLWKLFGKSLLVSHLAMFPFIFGILYQLDAFLKNSDEGKKVPLLILLIVVCDATLLSQMSMITFDIPQIFFFLWCINCMVNKKYNYLAIAFAALVLTSLRGSICGFGVVGYAILSDFLNHRRLSLKTMFPFFPGLILLGLFLFFFYMEKNWIIHNLVSNKWKESSEFASFSEIIRNIGLVGWRLIDFGRIGIWLIFSFILVISLKKKMLFDRFYATCFYVALCQFIAILPFVVFYRNSFGHRYFLPVLIFVAISVTYWILKYSRHKVLIYCLTFAIVLSGYFWDYPDTVAQGWDATPSHWSYYPARNEMLGYLATNKIQPEIVGTFFPNIASFRLVGLNNDRRAFKDADLEKDEYILFSNVFNVRDELISELSDRNKWEIENIVIKRNVKVILYRRIKNDYY